MRAGHRRGRSTITRIALGTAWEVGAPASMAELTLLLNLGPHGRGRAAAMAVVALVGAAAVALVVFAYYAPTFLLSGRIGT